MVLKCEKKEDISYPVFDLRKLPNLIETAVQSILLKLPPIQSHINRTVEQNRYRMMTLPSMKEADNLWRQARSFLPFLKDTRVQTGSVIDPILESSSIPQTVKVRLTLFNFQKFIGKQEEVREILTELFNFSEKDQNIILNFWFSGNFEERTAVLADLYNSRQFKRLDNSLKIRAIISLSKMPRQQFLAMTRLYKNEGFNDLLEDERSALTDTLISSFMRNYQDTNFIESTLYFLEILHSNSIDPRIRSCLRQLLFFSHRHGLSRDLVSLRRFITNPNFRLSPPLQLRLLIAIRDFQPFHSSNIIESVDKIINNLEKLINNSTFQRMDIIDQLLAISKIQFPELSTQEFFEKSFAEINPFLKKLTDEVKFAIFGQILNNPWIKIVDHLKRMTATNWFKMMDSEDQQRAVKIIASMSYACVSLISDRKDIFKNSLDQILLPENQRDNNKIFYYKNLDWEHWLHGKIYSSNTRYDLSFENSNFKAFGWTYPSKTTFLVLEKSFISPDSDSLLEDKNQSRIVGVLLTIPHEVNHLINGEVPWTEYTAYYLEALTMRNTGPSLIEGFNILQFLLQTNQRFIKEIQERETQVISNTTPIPIPLPTPTPEARELLDLFQQFYPYESKDGKVVYGTKIETAEQAMELTIEDVFYAFTGRCPKNQSEIKEVLSKISAPLPPGANVDNH